MTRNAQPALFATSMAAVRVLESELGKPLADQNAVCAGHSLGEYAALAAAGGLQIGDAARLLRQRGDAMQEAVPVGAGAMAAILGGDEDQISAIIAASKMRVWWKSPMTMRPGRLSLAVPQMPLIRRLMKPKPPACAAPLNCQYRRRSIAV